MDIQTSLSLVFGFVVIVFLVADLGYFNRRAHRISTTSALVQSLFWIVISLLFAVAILVYMGKDPAIQFLSAYVTEKMLSVDNLFVMLLIFNFFKLDEKYHHRVLFWGILGAIVFRAVFITAGSIVVGMFHWVLYIFGIILIYTGYKLLTEKKEEHVDFRHNRVFRFADKYLAFTTKPHEGKFFIRDGGTTQFTVMFMVLLLIETTDIVFAVDSIPAAFAITQNPFLLFTSNIFAVLGLRALFFLIENVMHKFHHLQKGLSFILIFIGAKMFSGLFHIEISSLVSFLIIIFALSFSLLLSILFPKKI